MRRGIAFTACVALVLSATQPVAADSELTPKDVNRVLIADKCGNSAKDQKPVAYPFSPVRLEAIYSGNKRRSSARVAIIDNGFLGYTVTDGVAQPSSAFTGAHFKFGDDDGSFPSTVITKDPFDQVAPDHDTTAGSEGDLYRIQYGHGTHVTGLVIGGPLLAKPVPVPGSAAAGSSNADAIPRNNIKLLIVDTSIDPHDYRNALNLQDFPLSTYIQRASQRADIINMSLSTFSPQNTLPKDWQQLIRTLNDILIVVAAGNGGKDLQSTKPPNLVLVNTWADRPNVITVGSYNPDDTISEFSDWGNKIDIAAPGCQILSWIDDGEQPYPLSGTSMATPLTTFAAALLRSIQEQSKPDQLRYRLIASARYNPKADCGDPGRSPQQRCVRTGGLLDTETALAVTKNVVEIRTCQDLAASGAPAMTPTLQNLCGKTWLGAVTIRKLMLHDCIEQAVNGSEKHALDVDRDANLPYATAVRRKSEGEFSIVFASVDSEEQWTDSIIPCPVAEDVEVMIANAESIDKQGQRETIKNETVPLSAVQRIVVRMPEG